MSQAPRTQRAVLFAATGVAVFLGVGASLPLWDVADGWGRMGGLEVYMTVILRRHGTLWDAVAKTPGLFRTFGLAETWAFHFPNFVVGALLLALGAVVGLLCYWFRSRPLALGGLLLLVAVGWFIAAITGLDKDLVK